MKWIDKLLRRGSDQVPHVDLEKKRRLSPTERMARRLEMAKQSGRITQERQLHAGILEYRWATAKDSRVCVVCAKNEGKRFFWNSPPPNGHPGQSDCCPDGSCRCVALALIPGVNG